MSGATFQLQYRAKQGGEWTDAALPQSTHHAALAAAIPHRQRAYRVVPSTWRAHNLHKLREYDGATVGAGRRPQRMRSEQ